MHSTGAISLQANPAPTYRAQFSFKEQTFRFQDSDDKEDAIWTEKKRQTGKLHFTSFTRKVNTVIFLLKEVKPSPNHKMMKLQKHLRTWFLQ